MTIVRQFDSKLRLITLSESDIQAIHEATLKVLDETGTLITHPEARKLLANAGCRLDGDIVHIPQKLVEWALAQAPKQIVLYNRDGDEAIVLEGANSYFGNGPTCPSFLDPETEQQRKLTLEDAKHGSILLDALPNLDFIMSFAQISDVPPNVADRYEFKVMVENCTKPIVFLARSVEGVRDILEMAAAVSGGYEQLAANPFVVCYPEPISPLKHPDDAVAKLLLAAKHGIPIVYTPAPMAGGTAPVTLAGLLVIANAETLTGLVMSQLERPGVGFITGGVVTIMDMRTAGVSYGAPEMDLVLAAFSDLAHHYGLPIYGTAGCTDSKMVDQQAAIESSFSVLMSILSGANLIHDVGYTESGLSFSFNQMVMGDEVIGMARRIARGIEVNQATLAVDVIARVGPGGQFLTDDHTLEYFRDEHWHPTLMDRGTREAWVNAGSMTFGDRTKEKMKRILTTHEVKPLSADVQKKIDGVISRLNAR